MRTSSTRATSSVVLGAATGLRSQVGVAAVVVQQTRHCRRCSRRPWVRRLVLAAAAGELVVDKLPVRPAGSRPGASSPGSPWGRWPPVSAARTRQASWLPAAALGSLERGGRGQARA